LLTITNAGTAHADSNDQLYMALLASQGISNVNGTADAIEAGHDICRLRADGMDEMAVIDFVYANSQLPRYKSIFMVGAAEEVYCPYYWSGTHQHSQI